MKLLHIDSSVLGDNSVSRAVSAGVAARIRAAHPGVETVYHDLAADPLPHLALSDLADHTLADEFLASDVVVIGAPMYNFGLASQLKAWIDRIAISGKTFRYGANGPEGLAGGKRVIVAIARGGLYGPGSAAAALEHVESYLRGLFGFLGVTDVEFIVAEGVNLGPDQRQQSLAGALQTAGSLAPVAALAA